MDDVCCVFDSVVVSIGDCDIGYNDEGELVFWVECLDLWFCKNSSSFGMGLNGGLDLVFFLK